MGKLIKQMKFGPDHTDPSLVDIETKRRLVDIETKRHVVEKETKRRVVDIKHSSISALQR